MLSRLAVPAHWALLCLGNKTYMSGEGGAMAKGAAATSTAPLGAERPSGKGTSTNGTVSLSRCVYVRPTCSSGQVVPHHLLCIVHLACPHMASSTRSPMQHIRNPLPHPSTRYTVSACLPWRTCLLALSSGCARKQACCGRSVCTSLKPLSTMHSADSTSQLTTAHH
jgi:hypothetical protein